jgi:catalase
MSSADDSLAVRMVDVIDRAGGPHPGYRRGHARGLVLRGTFQPTPEARALTAAEHFRGPAVPVQARLSNSDSNPFAGDRASSKAGAVLGLGVRFQLPSGAVASWAAASLPAFPARRPEDFVALREATRPSLLLPFKVIGFIARRRWVVPVLKGLRALKPARSFATTGFNGVHTYFLVNDNGERQAARYSWAPRATEAPLRPDEASGLPLLYLLEELRRRLSAGPVEWDLRFHLPAPTDSLTDASQAWPEDRRTIVAGTLSLTAEEPDQRALETLVFDPTGVVPGIELSDDPLLRFRAAVYSESYRRRSAETRDAPAPADMHQ